jgi:hypothetical protein
MSTTIDSIFKPEELRKARTEAINETVEELRVFARKAPDPAKRIALSELEQLLRETRDAWVKLGLVTSTEGAGGNAGVAA